MKTEQLAVNELTKDQVISKTMPWLLQYLSPETKLLEVGLIDESTLDLTTKAWENKENGWYHPIARLLMLDTNGKMVDEVSGWKIKEVPTWKWTWKFPFTISATKKEKYSVRETVESAVKRIGVNKAKTVRFIVSCSLDEYPGYFSVMVLKLPKTSPDLHTWLEQKAAEKKSQLDAVLLA